MSSTSLEQRITKLETEVKALKSIYTISGSAVLAHLSTGVIKTSSTISDVKIKFTPNYTGDGNITVYSVYAYEQVNNTWTSISVYLEPQDETTDIIAVLPTATPGETYKIELTASVPGTFAQIQ